VVQHLVQRHRLRSDGDHPGLEPGGVEQVRDQVLKAVGGVLDGREQLLGLLLGPADVVLAEAADRRLEPGQRGPHVMADGGEESCAHLVGCPKPLGGGGLEG
jgi:hypothetical protein